MVLIAARFMTGLGAAMVFGTSFALLSLSLSERERGEALGINIASNLTGLAFGILSRRPINSIFKLEIHFPIKSPYKCIGNCIDPSKASW
jgi:MFS family permease